MRKGRSSLEQFMLDALVSCLVTEQDEKGEICIVLDNCAENDDDRNFLYVPPRNFLKVISKIRDRNEQQEWSVGVKGVNGYAAEFMDVREDRFLDHILSSVSDACRAYFQTVYDAKPLRKLKPKKTVLSRSNVIPFRAKKGRKGRR
jgi:hypothetical protein